MQKTLYDTIGSTYNNTRKADSYITERLFSLLNPQKEKKYLDTGCGSGNYTIALSEKGLDLTGIDPSDVMLSYARLRNANVKWLKGTAENLSFDNETFEGAIATLTIHHWENLEKSFGEILRVLKSNGKMVIFTSDADQMKGYWLNHYFPEMMSKSIVNMPAKQIVVKALSDAGFRDITTELYFVHETPEDKFLYSGKNNPQIYFDKDIQKGISSFALHNDVTEIKNGLLKLRDDIDSGFFKSIKSQFENNLGDYLFISATK